MRASKTHLIEWPTLALLLATWGLFVALTLNYQALPWWLVMPGGACLMALYGSLQHEIIHGHPTRWRMFNESLVFPSLWIWLPFAVYRDTHLQHHNNELITDPFDDPESYYVSGERWDKMPEVMKRLYLVRNTLAGRLLLGPVWILLVFLKEEIELCLKGDIPRLKIWGLHLVSVIMILAWLRYCQIPFFEYFVFFIYPGFSLSLLRSFLEHQAHSQPQQRTVIVNSGLFFSLLFLNNNLHALHHEQPGLPWYQLPNIWNKTRVEILHRNGGYFFRGYRSVFRRYSFSVKTHPRHPFI